VKRESSLREECDKGMTSLMESRHSLGFRRNKVGLSLGSHHDSMKTSKAYKG
jgi:hypothetical protein